MKRFFVPTVLAIQLHLNPVLANDIDSCSRQVIGSEDSQLFEHALNYSGIDDVSISAQSMIDLRHFLARLEEGLTFEVATSALKGGSSSRITVSPSSEYSREQMTTYQFLFGDDDRILSWDFGKVGEISHDLTYLNEVRKSLVPNSHRNFKNRQRSLLGASRLIAFGLDVEELFRACSAIG